MPYIGRIPEFGVFQKQTLAPNDIDDTFTLDFPVASGGEASLLVSFGGVVQEPGTSYVVSSGTIVFSFIPASGNSLYIIYLGQQLSVPVATGVADNSIGSNAIINGTIVDIDISASASINPLKISPGTIDSTEFGFLEGVTSAIQGQIDGNANEALASQAEAQAGTENTKTMTPLRVSEAITALAVDTGEDNVALASQAEAEAGVENTKTMTALRSAQAIAALATGGGGLGFKNKIINGDFRIAQRGTSFVSPAVNVYTLDRWHWLGKAAAGLVTITQNITDTPNDSIKHSIKIDVTTADASVVAGDFYILRHFIEGNDVTDLGLGKAGAKQITLSFWVKAPKTGIQSVSFFNAGHTRSYIAEYTIDVVNTWEFKTITITGDTTGTWLNTNGLGLGVGFNIANAGTGVTAPDVWTAGNFDSSTNSVLTWMDNVANNIFFANVQLEVGDTATDFDVRPHAIELLMCRRYFQLINSASSTGFVCTFNGTNLARIGIQLNPEMRATPTITRTAGTGGIGVNTTGLNSQANTLSQSNFNNKAGMITFQADVGNPWPANNSGSMGILPVAGVQADAELL